MKKLRITGEDGEHFYAQRHAESGQVMLKREGREMHKQKKV